MRWLCLTGKKKVVSLDKYFLLLIVGSDIDLKCQCIRGLWDCTNHSWVPYML